jgi:acyl transferase domain-containing protein/NAD(P)H-dependent flavin oxidoreductase YrpB (nitropropane dioxygenase family)
LETIRAEAFPLLHLGRDPQAAAHALAEVVDGGAEAFGVVYAADQPHSGLALPPQVTQLVAPWGMALTPPAGTRVVWQVHSLEEGRAALGRGVEAIAVKGSEGGGRVGQESSFLLFQGLLQDCAQLGTKLYIHGGAGVHSSAAYWALGAQGVIFDSQAALFPECDAPRQLKDTLAKLHGGETQVVDGFRVLRWPAGPHLAPDAALADVLSLVGGLDLEANLLPAGQDLTLASEYAEQYTSLPFFVRAVVEAAHGHLRQAQANPALRPDSPLAQELGVGLPILQGPMARVSDEPEFLLQVSQGQALPSLALGLAADGAADKLLTAASARLAGRPWAVGLLGFIQPAAFEDQVARVLGLEHKPTAVVIAGGRPGQGKRLATAGVTAFLHVQSPGLLEQYIKEGARHFIFEGRESGGHVGPTPSVLLWERMIIRLLATDAPGDLTAIFAGGVHDATSSAFVSLMTASLAARGAKIGVVLGSAYLFTSEAVASGAITQLFQDLALEASGTVLLESAKGQETRALPTPFVDFFALEKTRLQDSKLDDLARRAALEELNLGRARIAAKGLDRADGKTEVTHDGARQGLGESAVAPGAPGAAAQTGGARLVALSPQEQRDRGVFMCGAVTALIDQTRTIAELHQAVIAQAQALVAALAPTVELESALSRRTSRVRRVHDPKTEPVAIVGLAGIFPRAANADEFWRNTVLGVDTVMEVPKARWDPEVFYRPDSDDRDFVCSKWGSFISPIEFDPVEFGITPQSILSIETTQLLGLLVAKRALQDAGYHDFKSNAFRDTSVIFGVEAMGELSSAYGSRPGIRQLLGDLPDDIAQALPTLTEDSFAGVLSNVTAGRIANRLNCGGRNYTVDAACASSLASLDLACQELWTDRSNLVVCGGVDLHNSILDYLFFNATYALSRRGYTATFDESGDGLTIGEGAGALVLKRLSDAERDGDRIYALVRGIQGSSDGRSLGLTAPNVAGQTRAVQRAYQLADLLPSQIGLFEAHGTGTAVGDRTELSALTNVLLDAGALPGQAYIGSVKTQIGHTKCAAGVIGVIRAALAVYHGVIPPTNHLEKPVRSYVAGRSPVAFNANGTATVWNDDRRLAGVSGFGFGGTNYHAILQNHVATPAEPVLKAWPAELLVFRGADLAQAQQQMRRVQALWQTNRYLSLLDLAQTLAQAPGEVQAACVAQSWSQLLDQIEALLESKSAAGVFRRDPKPGKVAFLFSGQGSQRVNMARELFVAFPQLRRRLGRHPEYFRLVFPPTVFTTEAKEAQKLAVTDTRNAQPLLGFVDLAVAELLAEFGVTPDLVAGHSYGELAALSFAGVVPADDLPALSRARAEAILAAVGDQPGQMAALGASADKVAELLGDEAEAWAVNLNSPRQTVVGGTEAGLARVLATAKAVGVSATRLNVACAFHTPLLAGADQTFAAALEPVKLGRAKLPVWSNTTAAPYPVTAAAVKRRLSQQLVNPVRWSEQLQAMYDDGARVFVEAGPGRVLVGLARDNLKSADVAAIAVERPNAALVSLLEALAQWLASGRSLDFERLFAGRGAKTFDLADPAKQAQSSTTFMVDGLEAVPLAQWRQQGYDHIPRQTDYTEDQLRQLRAANLGLSATPAGSTPEEVVQAYLSNVKSVLDDQRDVLLGYLGHTPAPRTAALAAVEAAPGGAGDAVAGDVLEGEVLAADQEDSGFALLQLKDLTPELVEQVVVEVVSEKTGYPPEMLGLDMDLEADLSIDSIKRLEIMGSLNERIDLPDMEALGLSEDDAAQALERMAAIKTLRGMIDWLKEVVEQAQAGEFDEFLNRAQEDGDGDPAGQTGEALALTAGVQPAAPAPAAQAQTDRGPTDLSAVAELARPTAADDPVQVVRLAVDLHLYPHPAGQPLSLDQQRLALVAPAALAAPVRERLAQLGAEIETVAAQEAAEADLTACDGLVMVNQQTTADRLTIEQVFRLVKATDLARLRWIVLFDDTVGQLTAAPDTSGLAQVQGFSGLLKTIQMEYPDKRVRLVDALSPLDPAALPDQVAAELTDADRFPSVAYRDGQRLRLLPQVQPVVPEDPDGAAPAGRPGLGLEADSVVLALGGAQGISPTLIARLAQDQPCHYVLVGRTPRDEALARRYADLADGAAIQRHLIQVEGFNQPKAIKSQVQAILKARSIEAALEQIAQTGAEVEYLTTDLTDQAQFAQLVADVKARLGHIDAVLHASGLLEDRLFKDKTWESFERVYRTKTEPLKTIVPLLDELKLLVLFSSMAASFGNRGQCDYAASNSVLDTVAMVLGQRQSPTRALAVAWGPWLGAGMVNSALEVELRKRGLALIPLDLGADFLARELELGQDPVLVAIAGQPDEITGFIDQALASA